MRLKLLQGLDRECIKKKYNSQLSEKEKRNAESIYKVSKGFQSIGYKPYSIPGIDLFF